MREEGQSWSGREPNTLFQNRGDGTFDEVGNVLGLYLRLDSRGAAVADLDGDGDLDLVVYNRNNPTVKVFRNDTPGQGNFAQVDLVGVTSEPGAAGAQAVLRCGGRQMLRQVTIGSGFLSQNPPTLHFGLGGCSKIDSLQVRWPGGEIQSWEGLPINRRITLREGSQEVASTALMPRNYNRNELGPVAGELSATVPDESFPRLRGEGSVRLTELRGTAVLNFWATWCVACLSEMPELEALHRRFVDRGVRFIGVSLDEGQSTEAVQAFADERGVSYEQVRGEVEQQRPFTSLANSPPGAIPVTTVIHRGTVRDVHVGKVDAEGLAELLERLLAR